MKKTTKIILSSLLLSSLLLSSCTKYEESSEEQSVLSEESSSESVSESTSSEEESEIFDFSLLSKEELAEFITIGEYKGLESEKVIVNITEKDVEDEIKSILEYYTEWTEVKDRPVKDGDKTIIDYKGYMNGELFQGGTADGQELVIGSDRYIDGFEDGLIGASIGETVTLNLSFPENYGNEDLNGKPVEFQVTIKEIYELTTPELSEKIIKEVSKDKATNEAEFKNYLYETLLEKATDEKNIKSISAYWDKVVNNATVIKYPDGIVDEYIKAYVDYYTQYASLYGVTLEEYLGCTEEKFREDMKKKAETLYKEQMVLYATIGAENYDTTIEEEKYEAWLEIQAEAMNTTVDVLKSRYSVETLQNTYVMEKFLEHIYTYRTEIEPKEETSKDVSEDTSENASENN